MSWYTACLVFEVQNHHTQTSVYEESWVLLQAENESDAVQKAQLKGEEQNEVFLNQHNEQLSWNFLGFRHVKALDITNNFAEITSISTTIPGYIENHMQLSNYMAQTG